MDRTERLFGIDRMLRTRRAVPLKDFIDRFEVSRATAKRDIEYMRDRMNAPIIYDRTRSGYRYRVDEEGEIPFEMPGLWFSAAELHALLTAERLLAGVQPGFLSNHIEPLRKRIDGLLEEGDHSAEELRERIRILHVGAREVEEQVFQRLATGLLHRKRLRIEHYNRRTDSSLERDVSPQRLVWYRDNWYLDAWCHLRKGLRSFGVDVIRSAQVLDRKTKDVAKSTLDRFLGSGYGIFSGTETRIATLKFSPERSRWVSRERWHSDQEGAFELDHSYVLKLPYSNQTELLMDILRHGAEVEVLGPPELRNAVADELRRAAGTYGSD